MDFLKNKIDYTVVFSVKNANPNGDPLNGNRPRENYEGHGEMSDVCIKRKIRNRLQDLGERIFIQADDRSDDGCKSLRERAARCEELQTVKADVQQYAQVACRTWFDVRAFGQVFAFRGMEGKKTGVSIGVRGPVSVQTACSLDPVTIHSVQITKSASMETGEKRGADTMGVKHRVDFGVYLFSGSINCQLAEKTGFTERDAELLHQALITLFENDSSAARPEGSMKVERVFWWRHNCPAGQYASGKVHQSVRMEAVTDTPKCFADYKEELLPLAGLEPEIYKG